MRSWEVPLIGIVGVLALLGALSHLPPYLSFFISAFAIILFPGIAVTRLVGGGRLDLESFPERLAVWFVVGTGSVTALGLMGLALKLHLADLIPVAVICYALLAAVLILRRTSTRKPVGRSEANHRRVPTWPVSLIVVSTAVGLALFTLISPRDYDDWYYLAYIKDYAAGARLASEDAIFNMENSVTPRIWFGGGWWVLEGLLARVSGVDPIDCHQVYLPLLVLPFAVFALFTLVRRLFRSAWSALLACGFQMLFYLSSAYPYKSAGWMVFARIAQDKVVSCFVVVPVAAAVALKLFDQSAGDRGDRKRELIHMYWIAVLTSVLVHGMGPVWVGLVTVPFALVEYLRARTGQNTAALKQVMLPILVCAAILVSARGFLGGITTAPPHEVIPAPGAFSHLYLPGTSFSLGSDTTNPITWVFHKGFRILNPLFIMRYPLAVAGLVLTLGLVRYARSSLSARFLLTLTVSTLLVLFTPLGLKSAAWFMTPRMVFRLSWVFQWGLIITFFLGRLRMRPLLTTLILPLVVLALARGNPTEYAELFLNMRERNRPSADAEAAFGFLASEPSPQGVILASEATGRMIPAFLPDAYPVNFREQGPVGREELKTLVERKTMDRTLMDVLQRNRVRYILIEADKPLARALVRNNSDLTLEYTNPSYEVWKRTGGSGRPASTTPPK